MERLSLATRLSQPNAVHWGGRKKQAAPENGQPQAPTVVAQNGEPLSLRPDQHRDVFDWLMENRTTGSRNLTQTLPKWMKLLPPGEKLQILTAFLQAYPNNIRVRSAEVGDLEPRYIHQDVIKVAGLFFKLVQNRVNLKEKDAFESALRAVKDKPLTYVDASRFDADDEEPVRLLCTLHVGSVGVSPPEESPYYIPLGARERARVKGFKSPK